MATADLALRVVAQVDQAVAGMRRLTESTKQADDQASQTQSTFGKFRQSVSGLGVGLSAAAGGFAGAIAANVASAIGDAMQGAITRQLATIQQNLQQPTSGGDIVNQLQAMQQKAYGPKSILPRFVNYLFNPSQSLGVIADRLSGYNPSVQDQLDAFKALPLPEQLAALQTGRLGPQFRAAYNTANARQLGNEKFNLTLVNVNAAMTDANTAGRQIRAALDLRDRNNGQYQTTLTRRG